MRRLALLVLLPLGACLSVTEPFPRPKDAVDVNVDFCSTDLPTWFAVKNEGQGWHVISRSARQRHVIAVSPKVTVAFGRTFLTNSINSHARVMFVTADELASATCGALIGQKTLYANVSGQLSTENVFAAMAGGFGSTDTCATGCSFGTPTQARITGVADGAVDLLAYRFSEANARTDYVLRHHIDAPHQSLLDPIDFTSAEAGFAIRLPLEIAGGLNAQVRSKFISAGGTTHELGVTNVAGGFGDYYALLPRMLAPGDLHRIWMLTPEGVAIMQYAGSGQAVLATPGPVLATPIVSVVQGDTVLRMRATLPFQAQYPRYASATFYQTSETDGFSRNVAVSVVISRAYLGADPGEWTLEIPPMPFLNSLAQLKPGVATDWHVDAWADVPPALFFGDKGAAEGTVVRCATALSTQSFSLQSAACVTPLALR